MGVLQALESAKITLEVLTKTKIGLTVNSFRKSANTTPESVSLSKQLIKNWKKLLPAGAYRTIYALILFVAASNQNFNFCPYLKLTQVP